MWKKIAACGSWVCMSVLGMFIGYFIFESEKSGARHEYIIEPRTAARNIARDADEIRLKIAKIDGIFRDMDRRLQRTHDKLDDLTLDMQAKNP